ncbi:bidirectional hydrogenase complex protein HoxU [bacterium]|nr:bidirectional hydrogenase complex protein HoxU [bacterium]
MSEIRTLTIDGEMISAPAGATVLDAAREHGIRIPTLCHLDGLSDTGACRLCLVEIEGNNRLQPACVTRVEEQMVVRSSSPRIEKYRRMILELLFAEGNHVCAVCVVNGHCDLQDLAYDVGMDHVRFDYLHPQREVDSSHDRFVLDHNRCILCARCVRVCDEIEGAQTLDIAGRGVASWIVSDLEERWGEARSCTSCGKCLLVCPTGSLFEKGLRHADSSRKADFLRYMVNVTRRQK